MNKETTELKTFERMNDLMRFYGELLTPSQKEIMQAYFDYNLSLSEISENLAISRPAVSDAIKKSSAKLEKYESRLGLVGKQKRIDSLIGAVDASSEADKGAAIEKLIQELKQL